MGAGADVTDEQQALALGRLVVAAQQWGAGTERTTICRWLRAATFEYVGDQGVKATAEWLATLIERDAHGSEDGLRRATAEYDPTQQEPKP